MSNPRYPIPAEYQSELELIDNTTSQDTRSDAEIVSSLNAFHPVTSERNIWGFWHSGLPTAPGWCQRNIVGWVRMCSPEFTIRILDNEPSSPNYVLKYLPASAFPTCFLDRKMDGPHSGQHSADFVRSATLLYHGGAYIDVGSTMIRHIRRMCWDELEDEGSPWTVCVPGLFGSFMANSFVAARKKDPFIEAWHTLFTHLWRDRTNSAGLLDHPLLKAVAWDTNDEGITGKAGMEWQFSVPIRVAWEYLTQVLCWMRLCQLDAPSPFPTSSFTTTTISPSVEPFVPHLYWRTHVLTITNVPELHPLEFSAGFQGGGKVVFDLLCIPADKYEASKAGVSEQQWLKAKEMVWDALARASLQKVVRGKNLTVDDTVGFLWDKFEGADCKEGTWAEVLRWGAQATRQTRKGVRRLKVMAAGPETVMKKGVLEI